RQAMPRGQGWGADALAGAQSLKCFPVGGGQMAVSSVTVTGQSDELGRRGIRRAEVSLVPARDYPAVIQARLDALPREVREAAGGGSCSPGPTLARRRGSMSRRWCCAS